MKETGVGLSDLGYFDNMLVADDDARPASMNDTRMKYGGVKRGGH